MPSWLPPLLITGAALVLMYFTCMRPMRGGHCAMSANPRAGRSAEESDAEVQQLRDEVARLRGDLDRSRVE
ncbi:hypothetical protein GCM10011584_03770 [Nocardioides phosphati]|uniref:DUF2933 domain-containing protein n=1 Tax=Nocardioides phosphati TaxID=1867775 RepID=A0ABQ2N7J0_9ACTN|nr:hypothetical protein [Nocardioides phosphati]GGO84961.1 hypothetical protein GCM10011584_03770 [Nocardioides phosphati]